MNLVKISFLLSVLAGWQIRGIEWSLRASASMRVECLFLRARAFDKQLHKFCEYEQASTHLIFAPEQFGQRPNFASTYKLNETILYPSK